jgi:hypothetical protein
MSERLTYFTSDQKFLTSITKKILFLCSTIHGLKKCQLPDVFELLNIIDKIENVIGDYQYIYFPKILELQKFYIDVIMLVDEEIEGDSSNLEKIGKILKSKDVEEKKKLRECLSNLCYKNPTLEKVINEYSNFKEKKMIEAGSSFLFGCLKGLDGEYKNQAIMLTKILNEHWKKEGVSEKELFALCKKQAPKEEKN